MAPLVSRETLDHFECRNAPDGMPWYFGLNLDGVPLCFAWDCVNCGYVTNLNQDYECWFWWNQFDLAWEYALHLPTGEFYGAVGVAHSPWTNSITQQIGHGATHFDCQPPAGYDLCDIEPPMPPPESLLYCLWCRDSDGTFVVLPSDQEPTQPGYVKAACDAYYETMVAAGNTYCTKPPPPPQDIPCCDKLAEILKNINTCKKGIYDECGAKINECCDKLDGCIDHIISKINEKLSKVSKSCKQCKDEAATSVAGTLEYAVACAKYATKTCDEEIECASGTDDGKPCTTCGEKPCCCKDGKCVPCPPKETEQGNWCGWCDYTTGLYVILKKDEQPPNTNYRKIICGDDQVAVHMATNAECEKITPPPVTEIPPEPSFPTFNTRRCDFTLYGSHGGIESMLSGSGELNFQSVSLQLADHLAATIQNGLKFLPPAEAIFTGIYGLSKLPFNLADELSGAIQQSVGCPESLWRKIYETLVGFSYVEKQLGVNLSGPKFPFNYAMNAVCRNRYPNLDGSIAAYLGNQIDRNALETLGGMDGFCADAIKWQTAISRAKPVPLQLAQLRRRDLLSPSEYDNGMRELGYLESSVRSNLFTISEQLPTYSDILRMMVRDADDQVLVDQFGLDTGFEEKFQSQLKEWTKWQGIPEKAAKYVWRAHWSIPSPTQLFEFWHRLRYKDEFGGKEKLETDIKSALIQQDILPYWHEHYLAVSFKPLTRTDARRGFEIGSLDEKQLKDSFLDQGYSDDNADILVKFAKRLRQQNIRNHRLTKRWFAGLINRNELTDKLVQLGYPTIEIRDALDDAEQNFITSPLAAAFVHGDLTSDTFTQAISSLGVSPEAAVRTIKALSVKITTTPEIKAYKAGRKDRASALAQSVTRGMDINVAETNIAEAESAVDDAFALRCQRGVRRRFILGEFDADEAKAALTEYGIVDEYADKVVKAWTCEKRALGKVVPTATLCRFLEQGAIQPADMIDRLKNIGHTAADSALIVGDCLQSISVKRAKQAERELKESMAAARRAASEQAKQQARAERDAAKLKRATEQAARTRMNREKQLAAAAEKLADRCQCGIYLAMESVKAEKSRLQSVFGFSIDESLAILLLSAEGFDGGTLAEFSEHVTTVAAGASTIEIEDIGDVSIESFSTNGEQ